MGDESEVGASVTTTGICPCQFADRMESVEATAASEDMAVDDDLARHEKDDVQVGVAAALSLLS